VAHLGHPLDPPLLEARKHFEGSSTEKLNYCKATEEDCDATNRIENLYYMNLEHMSELSMCPRYLQIFTVRISPEGVTYHMSSFRIASRLLASQASGPTFA
jgi:hypothetical protein